MYFVSGTVCELGYRNIFAFLLHQILGSADTPVPHKHLPSYNATRVQPAPANHLHRRRANRRSPRG